MTGDYTADANQDDILCPMENFKFWANGRQWQEQQQDHNYE